MPAQFHLDENYYLAELNKQKDTPIKVQIQMNMEKAACQFRMSKMVDAKSELNVIPPEI